MIMACKKVFEEGDGEWDFCLYKMPFVSSGKLMERHSGMKGMVSRFPEKYSVIAY